MGLGSRRVEHIELLSCCQTLRSCSANRERERERERLHTSGLLAGPHFPLQQLFYSKCSATTVSANFPPDTYAVGHQRRPECEISCQTPKYPVSSVSCVCYYINNGYYCVIYRFRLLRLFHPWHQWVVPSILNWSPVPFKELALVYLWCLSYKKI